MGSITAITVPADPELPMETLEVDPTDLDGYQQLVGGNVEAHQLMLPEGCMYVNGEGKLMGLKYNRRATAILWVHNNAFIEEDVIMGDALLVGPPTDGDDTSVPQELWDILVGDAPCLVQYRTNVLRRWVDDDREFNSWYMAYSGAINLYEMLPNIHSVRVAKKP